MIQSDAYLDRPDEYVANQCGHMVLGIVVAAFLPLHWGFDPVAAMILYCVVIEFFGQRFKLFWDSLEDTMWVGAGAMILTLHDVDRLRLFLIGAGLALAFGYWRRA